MAQAFELDSAWAQVEIGAGGWVTGIDIHRDGTIVARTDTTGAFIWLNGRWEPLVTAYSMPADTVNVHGVYEIRIAPSDSNIFYMEVNGGIYKSVDKGAHWTKTAFPTVVMDANGENRMNGEKMAIDPDDPNTVFAGTQHDGLWVTRDGGASWSKVAAIPVSTTVSDGGLTGIVVQGDTVYVGTAGYGVFKSSDGGQTWKSTSGGPVDIAHATLAPNGDLFVVGDTDTALWKYSGGTWTKVISDQVHDVAVDPFDPSHIVAIMPSGYIQQSHDGGATWSGWNWNTQLESSGDVGWLETSGKYMSVGGIEFDPNVPGKLYQAAGVGVWTTNVPADLQWNTPVVWNSQSAGIENLVANDIIAPAGGDPVFGSWDRAFFALSDINSYATSYSGGDFSMGWSLDYASNQPSFIVGISDWWGVENSGFSTDGGHTWQKFEGLPSFALNTIGGSIAASSSTNIIWAPAAATAPAYTLDGGKTWHDIQLPGNVDWTDFHFAYYLHRTTITADRVEPNTFYLYNTGSGVYSTHDGGVTWSQVYVGPVTTWSYWHAKIEAAPDKAGELFFTAGALDGDPNVPADVNFMHSRDGGHTWEAVAGVKEVATFGFGAPETAGGPATIFIVGFVNGEYGIWYSTDNAASWDQIGRFPIGNLGTITTISGDMDEFGLVYAGLNGGGYVYLSINDPAPPLTAPTSQTDPAPTQSTSVVDAVTDVGLVAEHSSGDTVGDTTPTIRGALSEQLRSGQVVAVYRDGQMVGHASTNATSWTFTDPGAPDGNHSYSARVENSSGAHGPQSNSFVLTIDVTAPTQVAGIVSVIDNFGAVTGTVTSGATIDDTSPTLQGTLAGSLGADERLVVYRDGAQIGVANVNDGFWTFDDNGVSSGSHSYSAQVEDAAGNLGPSSSDFRLSVDAIRIISGTHRNDVLFGTSGADIISGLPANGAKMGVGTIDTLTGNGGPDIFVLGNEQGVFYDDHKARLPGVADYARITDFGADDHIRLYGTASDYFQSVRTMDGVQGVALIYDSNDNGKLDARDELIGFVQHQTFLSADAFIYI